MENDTRTNSTSKFCCNNRVNKLPALCVLTKSPLLQIMQNSIHFWGLALLRLEGVPRLRQDIWEGHTHTSIIDLRSQLIMPLGQSTSIIADHYLIHYSAANSFKYEDNKLTSLTYWLYEILITHKYHWYAKNRPEAINHPTTPLPSQKIFIFYPSNLAD